MSETSGIDLYRQVSQPPRTALKVIGAGRLKGKSDINPQWRYQAMTEVYGLCGVGWRFEVTKKWTEPGPDGQLFAFADVALYVKVDDAWSTPIPGTGGSKLVDKERSGLYANDEAFKMAVTDALSTAMKMVGVASDIYMGAWDGARYRNQAQPTTPPVQSLSPEDQKYIEDTQKDIVEAESHETLKTYASALQNKPQAVRDAVRPAYSKRHQELSKPSATGSPEGNENDS